MGSRSVLSYVILSVILSVSFHTFLFDDVLVGNQVISGTEILLLVGDQFSNMRFFDMFLGSATPLLVGNVSSETHPTCVFSHALFVSIFFHTFLSH